MIAREEYSFGNKQDDLNNTIDISNTKGSQLINLKAQNLKLKQEEKELAEQLIFLECKYNKLIDELEDRDAAINELYQTLMEFQKHKEL